MFACICHPTTETEVAEAVVAGDVTDVESAGEVLGAGTGCGSCHEHLEQIVAGSLSSHCPLRQLIAA